MTIPEAQTRFDLYRRGNGLVYIRSDGAIGEITDPENLQRELGITKEELPQIQSIPNKATANLPISALKGGVIRKPTGEVLFVRGLPEDLIGKREDVVQQELQQRTTLENFNQRMVQGQQAPAGGTQTASNNLTPQQQELFDSLVADGASEEIALQAVSQIPSATTGGQEVNISQEALGATNLFDFYQAQGQSLPKRSVRAQLFEQFGLGSAEVYRGTTEQNDDLLNALKTSGTTGGATGGQVEGETGATSETGGSEFTSDQQDEVKNTETTENEDLDRVLSESSLSDDEKEAIRAYFNAVAANNKEEQKRIVASLELGETFADPIFKQKVRLIEDALVRSLNDLESDLTFKESQLQNALNDLREDVELQREQLTLSEQTELNQFERKLEGEKRDMRQNLASRGLTRSTRRQRSEDIIKTSAGEIRESTKREFAARRRDISEKLSRGQRDTQAEIERLQEEALSQRKGLARKAEEQLGTKNLPDLPGLSGVNPLGDGDITGNLAFEKRQNISQFIF